MKTEDIDKKIGMPDVDKEWARFEQEVIGKEPKANKRSIFMDRWLRNSCLPPTLLPY